MIAEIKKLLDRTFYQPNVLGILLMGSVSANVHDHLSDVDLLVIYEHSEPEISPPDADWDWDISYMSEKELKSLRDQPDWRANGFLTAQFIMDKTTWLPSVIKEICTLSNQEYRDKVSEWLDGYLNSFYRSMKAVRRNNELGALLQASSSIVYFINCIFSLNRLISPYLDRIEILLNRLEYLPMEKAALSEILVSISKSANPNDQIRLFKATEKLLKSFGFEKVYEAWDNKLENEVDYWRKR